MKFAIAYDKDLFRYTKQLEKRILAVSAAVPALAAETYWKEIRRLLPKGEYSKSIMPFKADNIFGVSLQEEPSREEGTLIFVNSPTTNTSKSTKTLVTLQKFSPWTKTTLPELSVSFNGFLVYRKVSVQQEQARERQLRKVFYAIRKELFAVGLRPPKPTEKIAKSLLAEGLIKEFSFGQDGKPHWRPALRKLSRSYSTLLINKSSRGMMYNPKNKSWKKDRKWSYRDLPNATVLKYEDFMNKIGRM